MGGRAFTKSELDRMFSEVREIVMKDNVSMTTACERLGYIATFLSNRYLGDRKKELIQIHADRNRKHAKKKVNNNEYYVPKPSPFKPIYYPKLIENNYLI